MATTIPPAIELLRRTEAASAKLASIEEFIDVVEQGVPAEDIPPAPDLATTLRDLVKPVYDAADAISYPRVVSIGNPGDGKSTLTGALLMHNCPPPLRVAVASILYTSSSPNAVTALAVELMYKPRFNLVLNLLGPEEWADIKAGAIESVRAGTGRDDGSEGMLRVAFGVGSGPLDLDTCATTDPPAFMDLWAAAGESLEILEDDFGVGKDAAEALSRRLASVVVTVETAANDNSTATDPDDAITIDAIQPLVRFVVVGMPLPALEQGLVVVDVPGRDMNVYRRDAASQAMATSTCAMVLHSANTRLDPTWGTLLTEAAAANRALPENLFVVVTKADIIPAPDSVSRRKGCTEAQRQTRQNEAAVKACMTRAREVLPEASPKVMLASATVYIDNMLCEPADDDDDTPDARDHDRDRDRGMTAPAGDRERSPHRGGAGAGAGCGASSSTTVPDNGGITALWVALHQDVVGPFVISVRQMERLVSTCVDDVVKAVSTYAQNDKHRNSEGAVLRRATIEVTQLKARLVAQTAAVDLDTAATALTNHLSTQTPEDVREVFHSVVAKRKGRFAARVRALVNRRAAEELAALEIFGLDVQALAGAIASPAERIADLEARAVNEINATLAKLRDMGVVLPSLDASVHTVQQVVDRPGVTWARGAAAALRAVSKKHHVKLQSALKSVISTRPPSGSMVAAYEKAVARQGKGNGYCDDVARYMREGCPADAIVAKLRSPGGAVAGAVKAYKQAVARAMRRQVKEVASHLKKVVKVGGVVTAIPAPGVEAGAEAGAGASAPEVASRFEGLIARARVLE